MTILIQSTFQCKQGGTGRFIERFDELTEFFGQQEVIKRARLLTDLSGSFDTVIVEHEVESIQAYYDLLKAMHESQDAEPNNADEAPLYVTGSRTIYTIERTL